LIPLDALLILNFISRQRREPDLMPTNFEAPFYDVNGDMRVEPLDALLVLTEIARRRLLAIGEAEARSISPPLNDIAFSNDREADEPNDRLQWRSPPEPTFSFTKVADLKHAAFSDSSCPQNIDRLQASELSWQPDDQDEELEDVIGALCQWV
jgi:hypothetical protein